MKQHSIKQVILWMVALCFSLLFVYNTSNAQIPQKMSYQGSLMDATGAVVPDGNYNISFKLYEVPTGGTQIWEEGHSVEIIKGMFNVILGTIHPLGLPFDKEYWLGVRLAGDPELTPRMPLTSSAYSLNARSVAQNAVTSLSIADGAVEEMDLANGAVTASKIAAGPADGVVLTTSGGNVVWQTPSGGGLSLPFSGSTSSPNPSFLVTNTGSGHAISAESSGGIGVRGESSGGIGVAGKSSSGIGVGGQSTSNSAVFGSSTSGDGLGGESSSGNGVWGKSSSGIGVVGTNTVSGNYGELGTSFYGIHAVGFGNAIGVFAQSSNEDAVRGWCTGSNKSGVYGVNEQGDGYGVYGRNAFNGNVGYLGGQDGAYGATNVAFAAAGVRGISTANGGTGVWGQADTGSNAWGVHGWSNHGAGVHGGSISGTAVYAAGASVATGSKSAEVKLMDGSPIRLFAEEATEVFFNDYSEARLSNGSAHIELDRTFLQTVTIDAQHPMKVFVQLEDDCKGVYVTNKTTTGFDVVELQGGISDARFIYRIVCKRKFYEDERLATQEQDSQFNQRMLEMVWPEVIEKHNAEQEQMKTMPVGK